MFSPHQELGPDSSWTRAILDSSSRNCSVNRSARPTASSLAVSARWSSSFFLCCHGVLFGRRRLDQDVLGRVRNVLAKSRQFFSSSSSLFGMKLFIIFFTWIKNIFEYLFDGAKVEEKFWIGLEHSNRIAHVIGQVVAACRGPGFV
jgi:hypothetical protein